jgi:hypothetical protein
VLLLLLLFLLKESVNLAFVVAGSKLVIEPASDSKMLQENENTLWKIP